MAIPSSSGQGTSRPSGRRTARLARRRVAGGAAVLRPKEVCAQLAVSVSTLRAWSTEFKDYLSPAAQAAPAPGRAHRRYTAADVQVLASIGRWLHLGHQYDEVKRLLPSPARRDEPAAPDASTQLAECEQRLRVLEDALGRARARIGSLEDQAERYEGRLQAEQAAHAETRRALAEAQRKLAEAQRVNARLAEANAGLHAQVDRLQREVNAPVWQRVFR